MYKFQNPIEKS